MRTDRRLATALAMTMLGLGAALLAVTIAEGGGQVGILLGLLFLAAGGGRLYLARRA